MERAVVFAQPHSRIKDTILGPQVCAVVKEQRVFATDPVTTGRIRLGKDAVVKSTFNIELKVDIGQLDEARRKAFIDLTVLTARQFYSQAAMISSTTPTISVNSIDRENGKEDIPIITFESED